MTVVRMLRNSRLSLLLLAFVLGILSSRIYDRVARPSPVQRHSNGINDRSLAGDQQKASLHQAPLPAVIPPSDQQPPSPQQQRQSTQHRGPGNSTEKVNAAFVILVQNKELHDMRKAMRML